MTRKVYLIYFATFLLFWPLRAQNKDPLLTRDFAEQMAWVEAQFQAMSLEERIGQLFMVAAYSNKGAAHEAAIARLVEQEGVGGLIFFQGGPGRQASLTNRYQELAKVPLFLAMDAEWGMQMRLDSLPAFPRAMTLGAHTRPDLIRTMGNEIGRQFREIGMHINFAPVVDVNANPRNPVIGNRSFGEDPVRVGQLATAYMKGLQEQKVLANAKHFPGHGDTEADSHHTLPIIRNSRAHLEEVDLVPFRMLFQEGLTSVMVAHLHIPALDATPNLATTLSPKVVQGLLQEEMGFQGLAFTDALNMKGVSNFNTPGEVDLKALLAGNDVLLFAEDVPKAKRLILEALRKGELDERVLNAKVVKILKAKYWAGLHRQGPVFTAGLTERLHTPATDALLKELYAASLTVLDNEDGFLPMKFLDLNRIATLTIGGDGSVFQEKFDRFAEAKHFSISKGETSRALRDKLAEFDVVVVNLMGVSGGAGSNYGLNRMDMVWLKDLAKGKTVVPVLYGSPYALAALSGLGNVVVAYENNRYVQDVVPELLFGARGTEARLPVTASFSWRVGSGEDVLPSGRLGFSTPFQQGMNPDALAEIDQIMEEGMRRRAFPGGVVLVAKSGKVVFERAYGGHMYEGGTPTTPQSIYDLASLTKVLATTQAVMFLADRGLLDVEQPLERYLPELRQTNKGRLKLRDVLLHEAGLKAYLPYYSETLEKRAWKSVYYQPKQQEGFSRPVAAGMYAMDHLRDSIWHWTIQSELNPPKAGGRAGYVYSDLTMYLLQEVVERLVQEPLDRFLTRTVYAPMGLRTLVFNPLEKLPLERIAPTEYDVLLRKTLVHGYVHDPGAAMFGGVAGHAGLFGQAYDVAAVLQMALNGGFYGDLALYGPETIATFTDYQSSISRRGFGWDKPEKELDKGGSAGKLAPKSTFGHTGFTGTCAWADPDNELIYVFLSNRVHPNAENNLLIKESYRQRIHDVIYKSMQIELFQERLLDAED